MNPASRTSRTVAVAALLVGLQGVATAQCGHAVRPGTTAGVSGPVNASVWWDPDGPGPAVPRWVVAGQFTIAGNLSASNIAAYEPAAGTWSTLGAGLPANVESLIVAANGDLIAGISFGAAGGSLFRWNGATWAAFAPGLMPIAGQSSGRIFELGVLPNGDIIAGGLLRVPSVAGAMHIARWNGTAWSALGSGSTTHVRALIVLANGDVVAGGTFSSPSGVASGIGRWNGTTWSSLGAGSPGSIDALSELPNGDLIAGGSFATIGGVAAANIARWNGSVWSALGLGCNAQVMAIAPLASGGFAAGGAFWTAGGAAAAKVASWNGVQWSSFGLGLGSSNALSDHVRTLVELPQGRLAAAGTLLTTGGADLGNLAIWNGASWLPTSEGFVVYAGSRVLASAVAPNGDVIVAGSFVGTGGINCIARWNGSAWSALGAGIQPNFLYPPLRAVAVLANGDVIAGGDFTLAGGVPASNIARWDGATWSPLGPGQPSMVGALLTLPNGDLLAAGAWGDISRWNGSTWSTIGTGFNGPVTALELLPNGDVIAAGLFPGGIQRYDGTAWSPLGAGVGYGVTAVAVMLNGDIVVGGTFSVAGSVPANRIARWNGTAWLPLGAGLNWTVGGLAVLPNGDLVAVGQFSTAGGVAVNGIARWNGTAWSPWSAGGSPGLPSLFCTRMLDDELLIGGAFSNFEGLVTPYVARLAATCPAIANTSGAGCPSSGGSNSLIADSMPWLGSTFTVTGFGLPTTAIIVMVTGFSSLAAGTAPLSLFFPQAGVGCDLLASTEILELLLTTTGTVQSSIVLPNALALVGAPFFQQMLPVELDPQGALVSITATNALQVTPGSF